MSASHDEASQREAWRLWVALTEQKARCAELEQAAARLHSSRSWRFTQPLRAANATLSRLLARRGEATQPALWPAETTHTADPPIRPQNLHGWLAPVLSPMAGPGPRWLVDVTELSRQDLGAGVERVTRRLLTELLMSPPATHRIEPVRLTADGRYCLARRFLASFAGLRPGALGRDLPVDPMPGDVLIGLDFCRDHAPVLAKSLQLLRDASVPVCLFVHDVLPVAHPEWFPEPVVQSFAGWLEVFEAHADFAICNTNSTACQLENTLAAMGLSLPRGGISSIPLGSDLPPVPGSSPLPLLRPGTVRVLTVGTVEPRKAHWQILQAFEKLWNEGLPFEWVIAGRQGWMVDDLATRLRGHTEIGRRLYWLEGPDDGTLQALYEESDMLLLASRGEGFGLPIAEAGRLGVPLLLRDIPVFREVAGDAAAYFSGDEGADIAAALLRWPQQAENRRSRAKGSWPTWEASACALKSEVARMLRSLAALP
ncbi:glycosyltransferase family 4 protein [Luteimonas sp. SX5]|uniref:Glycosyltransferase family 4 protein n=1 Tax=Luteimonas galliterrae TaxID=2940486 RepID=A0ABT0MK86_9GAMM|nr:glycosyltransferase family 1 protein [Luteimonas galliterrae]MCL1634639.1 glycosyltransferase family 4 protein [Luteimonas galliterrae]